MLLGGYVKPRLRSSVLLRLLIAFVLPLRHLQHNYYCFGYTSYQIPPLVLSLSPLLPLTPSFPFLPFSPYTKYFVKVAILDSIIELITF